MGVRAQLRENSSANAFYIDENGQWILQPSSRKQIMKAMTRYMQRMLFIQTN